MKEQDKTILEWYKESKDNWTKWRSQARTCYKYYFGDQWKPEVVQALNAKGKPALTMNKIKPVIRTLSGYMRQNRKDLKVMPRRQGVQKVANIYTELLKYVYDISYADWYLALAFLDGIICGKGFLSVDRDYTKDIVSGDLVLMREDPFLVYEDPYSIKYDMSDARYVFRCRWMNKKQIKAMFPEYDEQATSEDDEPLIDNDSDELDDYVQETGSYDLNKNRVLVKECWYRTWANHKYALIEGETVDITGKSEEDVTAMFMTTDEMGMPVPMADVQFIERVMPELSLAILVGNKVVSHSEDPLNGVTMFPIIRFADEMIYAEKPYIRGEIDDIISAQDEHNKRRSQALHLLNTTAGSGYIVEESAMSPENKRKLEAMGSKAGVVVTVEDGAMNKIKQIDPPPLSNGHVTLSNIADTDMKAVSGVNADLLGSDSTQANSGVAMEMRRRQGLINLEPVFDNFDLCQRVLGDTMLEIIKQNEIYTADEIADMTNEKATDENGQPIDYNEIIAFMKSKKGKYATTMGQQNNNPTLRAMHFGTMMQAIKEAQIPVPPEMIVGNSDWAFKDEWLTWYKTQQQQPMPQGQGMPEGRPMEEPPQMM